MRKELDVSKKNSARLYLSRLMPGLIVNFLSVSELFTYFCCKTLVFSTLKKAISQKDFQEIKGKNSSRFNSNKSKGGKGEGSKVAKSNESC